MLSSSQRQRANRAHQRRRLWAGALCAASFLAGQVVWGAPPAQLAPPDAPPTPSEVWRQYQVAKGAVSQKGTSPAQALRPATLGEPAVAPKLPSQPKIDYAVMPASGMAPVVTPEEVNVLRQAPAKTTTSPGKDQAAPPLIPARPLPLSGKAAEAALPPIVSAASLARPQPKSQPASHPAAEIKPVTDTRPVAAVAATAQPRLPFPAAPQQPIAPLPPIVSPPAPIAPPMPVAQPTRSRAEPMFIAQPAAPAPLPGPVIGELPAGSPFEVIKESGSVSLRVHRSLLMRTKVDIYRTAIVDEAICDVVQFTPREVSLIGRAQGSTHVTFWFDDPNTPPLTYVVKVEPDPQVIVQVQQKYQMLEDLVNEMYPDSKIKLVLLADKLLVKGQARDPEEAAQIMTILRAQGAGGGGLGGAANVNGLGGIGDAAATGVLPTAATGPTNQPVYQLINMLRVPGIQQVALKVKIAELNRTAARGFGVNVRGKLDFGDMTNGTQLVLATLLNPASSAAIIGTVDNDDLRFSIRYLQEHGVARLLSEPTLVTMSGRSATFVAGGEFPVPTIVGSVGLNAVTTDFRAFGAVISFMPTVIDKDHIRLQVSPEFSQINTGLSVGGTPGLNTRSATTTVEMREGQTLAIAGLIEDNYKAGQAGDFPFLARVFGTRDASRNETELIILVTPELMHPMEPEEVPPLPGFDVTEPNDGEFFLHGQLEGVPTRTHRTTVWPHLKKRYGAGGPAMTSGPFGHGQ